MNDKKDAGVDQEYIRVLSHQLKSPINTIQSLLSTISEGYAGEVSPQALSLVERAVTRASEAKEMIGDLLAYELYSQDGALPTGEYDLAAMVGSLSATYRSMASEKSISLRSDLPGGSKIYVPGDSRGMEHAVRNLLENAIHYTPPQGNVSVKLSVSERDKMCRLQIADTGFGIAEDEVKKIFDPFYRSIKRKANTPGTGLGLAIAKRIVDQHRGTVRVQSEENKGSVFTIDLPYTRLQKQDRNLDSRRHVVIIGGVTAGPKAAARLRRTW